VFKLFNFMPDNTQYLAGVYQVEEKFLNSGKVKTHFFFYNPQIEPAWQVRFDGNTNPTSLEAAVIVSEERGKTIKRKCKENSGKLNGHALQVFLNGLIGFGESEHFNGQMGGFIAYYYRQGKNIKVGCRGPITRAPCST